jgi:N-acetylmuramoyl-L-alanine amidase
VKAIRIGQPDDKENITRVVLDLTQPDCSVKQVISAEKNALSVAFTNGGPVLSVANTTVVLDAGHGGSDPGAQRGDIQEKELTLGITFKLKKYLESKGIRVVMTRSDDSFVSLEDRVKITNSTSADAFVSVHINSLESNNAITGIETYFQNDRSRSLANLIHASLVKELAVPDRNVRKARFYVINHTPLPAVLAEVGFISNKDERDKLISSDYQHQIAQALANGVILYLSNRSATGMGGTNSALSPSNSGKGFTQILQSQSSKAPNEAVTQLKSQKKQVASKRS